MAQYGAKYLRWAKMKSDEIETAFPVYDPSISLGPLVQVTDAITYVEGKNYGDNALEEYVSEFQELTVDAEMTEMPIKSASEVYGATLDEDNTLHYGKDDAAPDGGLAFYTTKQIKENGVRKTYHQGVYYTSLQASRQGTTYRTKGQSITFANGKAHFVGKASANGEYQVFSDNFATEAEAKAWVDQMLPPPTTTL